MNKSGILVWYPMLQISKRKLQNLFGIHLHDFMYILSVVDLKEKIKESVANSIINSRLKLHSEWNNGKGFNLE